MVVALYEVPPRHNCSETDPTSAVLVFAAPLPHVRHGGGAGG